MKKGQAWVQDTITSIIIIITTLSIFMIGYTNLSEDNKQFDEVHYENKLISEYLMLEGTPTDWKNETDVLRIGITNSDNTLNETKLESLYNMTQLDYDLTRSFLGTKYDYILFFTDYDGNLLNITKDYFFGKSGINNTNIVNEDTSIITKTERYTIHEVTDGTKTYKNIIKMNIYSWQ